MTQPEALTFPELLETVPNDAYLTIPNETGREVRIIPVGRYCHNAAAELRRLHHNNQVLTDALWKACGDDEATVNDTIASQGELK